MCFKYMKCNVLHLKEKVVRCPNESGLTGEKSNPSTFQTRFSGSILVSRTEVDGL